MKREQTRLLSDVIGDFVRESNLEEGLLQARVIEAWNLLVIGQAHLRDYTSRASFREGVLSCKISSSVVRSHLRFQVEPIRIQLNKMLQDEVVLEIKLT